jgi:hypothetical protein
MLGRRFCKTFGHTKMAWDEIVAHDKFFNACVFIIDKNPMLPAMDRIIPWTPAVVRESVLTPVVEDRFAQSRDLHNLSI